MCLSNIFLKQVYVDTTLLLQFRLCIVYLIGLQHLLTSIDWLTWCSPLVHSILDQSLHLWVPVTSHFLHNLLKVLLSLSLNFSWWKATVLWASSSIPPTHLIFFIFLSTDCAFLLLFSRPIHCIYFSVWNKVLSVWILEQ